MIKRAIKENILKYMQPNKAVVIYGPRRVGKTTLLKDILQELKEKEVLKDDEYLFATGESLSTQEWLSSQRLSVFRQHIGNRKLLIIDEAQKVPNIGLNIKLIVDHIEGIKVLATGSSSFDLANQVGEPLVGRKWQFNLYPISQLELSTQEYLEETKENLENRLIYGLYPEIVTMQSNSEKVALLESIVDSHLYKDIIELDGVRKSRKIINILTMLAYQIGHDVSVSEIANAVNLDARTVERYLDLLEKSFVIKSVHGFSRNLRKEVTKSWRYYFYDNGVRNAIIKNFNPLSIRNDAGALWENFLFMERMKRNEYKRVYANYYFWRTWDKKELDLIEERDGKLFGYEFKYNTKKLPKVPKDWIETYENASYEVITPENYLGFVM